MLAFIHIHKAAGQTVHAILASSFGRFHCDVEPWSTKIGDEPFYAEDFRRLRRFYPQLKSIAGHHVKPCIDLSTVVPEIQYFTLMRDPVRRTASNYQYAVQELGKKLPFEEWVEDEWHHNRQTKMIVESDDVNAAIQVIKEQEVFVGLTEHFDESMLMLKYLIANDLYIFYQRLNVARDNNLARQIVEDPRTRQMIYEVNTADLSLYNFVTKELYPTYRRAYGPDLQNDVEKFRQGGQDFNQDKMRSSRLKKYLVYKPLLYLYRKGIRI